jgi:hypothetical protein
LVPHGTFFGVAVSLQWDSAIAGSLFGDNGSKKVYIAASVTPALIVLSYVQILYDITHQLAIFDAHDE